MDVTVTPDRRLGQVMAYSGRGGAEADLEQQNDSSLDQLLRQVKQIKGVRSLERSTASRVARRVAMIFRGPRGGRARRGAGSR